MQLTDQELSRYIREHATPEWEVLHELDRETNLTQLQPRMLSGHIQGDILKMMVYMLRPQRVLEIGTFTGYSAIAMARAMEPGSELHTIDINDETEEIAAKYIERSGLGGIIRTYTGSALDVIPEIGGTFDLVFMDGDKREYPEYYNLLMDGGYLHSGSFILADNVLWDGKVTDESPKNLKDRYTQGILRFNRMVADDPRAEVVIVPLRDGLSIIRIR